MAKIWKISIEKTSTINEPSWNIVAKEKSASHLQFLLLSECFSKVVGSRQMCQSAICELSGFEGINLRDGRQISLACKTNAINN